MGEDHQAKDAEAARPWLGGPGRDDPVGGEVVDAERDQRHAEREKHQDAAAPKPADGKAFQNGLLRIGRVVIDAHLRPERILPENELQFRFAICCRRS